MSLTAEPAPSSKATNSLYLNIAIAWLSGLVGLSLAIWTGDILEDKLDLSWNARHSLQAVIMSLIVCSTIWYLQKFRNEFNILIGLSNLRKGALGFLYGAGILLVPFLITIIISLVFGYADFQINRGNGIFESFLVGLLATFFYEAFPEELLFRGYIYSHLNSRFSKLKSSVLTILSFVILPCVLVLVQTNLMNLENFNVGNSSGITAEYVIVIFLFGTFIQYLRVLTNTIWTGIGFHLIFVYFGKVMGPSDNNLIQVTTTDENTMQIVLAVTIGIVILSLIFYPLITKQRLGWKELSTR